MTQFIVGFLVAVLLVGGLAWLLLREPIAPRHW